MAETMAEEIQETFCELKIDGDEDGGEDTGSVDDDGRENTDSVDGGDGEDEGQNSNVTDGNELQVVSKNEDNGLNNYYVIEDGDRKYVAMHVVNGKFALYDYEFHDVISKFTWFPNNGFACTIPREDHKETFPDLPYELNRQMFMHLLIKEYLLAQNKENDKQVLHHINECKRDNRKENMIWVSKNQQRALLKKGKLSKAPPEVRHLSLELPRNVRWINAKKEYRIDCHPVNFLMVENKEVKHKYVESLKGKKWTMLQKYEDMLKKYEEMMRKPYGGQESYYKYLEHKAHMIKTRRELLMSVKLEINKVPRIVI